MNFKKLRFPKIFHFKNGICKISILSFILLSPVNMMLAQQYVPLSLTGFNADAICSSPDCSGTSTLDGEWYYYSSGKAVQGAIPQTITSQYGVNYLLNSFEEENVLTLGSNGVSSGKLILSTPQTAKELWILGMSASGQKNIDVVVKYTDNTSSETKQISFPDWYQSSGSGVSFYGLGRVKSSGTDGRLQFGLFERIIPVDPTKTVESVSFSYTGTDKTYTSIFAITAFTGGDRANDNNLYMIANAHFDTQWDWDVQTSIDQYVKNTLVDNFNLFDKYPDYEFNFEGAIKYMFAKEYYPDLYERLKGYIASGRWHVSGSSVDANDVMVPSAESIIRNLLLGEKYFQKEFGVNGGNDIMLPDCFGFPYSLPTLAKYCGIVGFHSQKLSWGSAYNYSDFPNYGLWQGVDGSQILAIYKPGAYVNKYKEDLSYNADILSELTANKTDLGAAKTVRYYGTGDRGGSVDAETVDWLEKSLASSGPVHVNSVTPDQFFESVTTEERSKLPVWNNELPMTAHGAGCYTSHAILKYWNRKGELLADATEKSSVVANWLGGLPYQSQTIHDSWVRLLWHQFHDDLTGTSIPKAYTFTTNDHVAVQLDLAKTLNNASGAVSRDMNTEVQGTPIVVFNPLSIQREDIVEAHINADSQPTTISMYDPSGNVVPAQITAYENGKLSFIFKANVPSLGYATYDLRLNDNASASLQSTLVTNSNTIENGEYILKVNSNGDIYSIVDKKQNNKELLKSPIRLSMQSDNPGYWASWEVSWGDIIRNPFAYVDENVSISVAEEGPLRSALKITRSKKGSQFVQFIKMTSGVNEDRIDIENEVDWQSKETLLKAVFPLSASNEKATFDLSVGAIERGNRVSNLYEVAGHQWADLTDAGQSYGISILNDCKYGWDKQDNNTLRLTLIHTPGVGSDRTFQKYQDLGLNKFTYSFYRHLGVWNESTQWQASKLNQPMYAYEAPKHEGDLGKSFGFVSLNTDKVAVKALKKAEESDEIVVRVYELTGNDQNNVEMTFPTNIISAREVNGREDDVDGAVSFTENKLTFSVARFQPRSFAVKLSTPATTIAQPASTAIPLVYNIDVMSNDALKKDGKFVDSNYAYPAELFSDEVNSDGISFTMGPRENGLLNAVQCKGQDILLPQSSHNKKLYILAASQDVNGSEVNFSIDGTSYPVKVEYFAENVGEWGTVYGDRKYKKENIAFLATHRHNVVTNVNDSYSYLYIFKYVIPVSTTAEKITLPNDPNVVVFAMTVSNNENDDAIPASTVENLPDFDYIQTESESESCGEKINPVRVTASGSVDAYERPAMAADNNSYSKWCDDGSNSVKWIAYFFDEPVQICQWNIIHAGIESDDNITSDFTLQYYNGTSWIDEDAVVGNTENKTVRYVTPFTSDRVRLKITKQTQETSTVARIYSFDVYGTHSHTGVANIKSDKENLVVYPNPIKRGSALYLNEKGDLKIYSLQGCLLFDKYVDGATKIHTSTLSAGSYILKLTDNKLTKQTKLIVQ